MSITPHPEQADGFIWVATNEPIPCGIEGTEDFVELDVGGNYVMHKDDVVALLQRLKELQQENKRLRDMGGGD